MDRPGGAVYGEAGNMGICNYSSLCHLAKAK
jgi:hypothetical protein